MFWFEQERQKIEEERPLFETKFDVLGSDTRDYAKDVIFWNYYLGVDLL